MRVVPPTGWQRVMQWEILQFSEGAKLKDGTEAWNKAAQEQEVSTRRTRKDSRRCSSTQLGATWAGGWNTVQEHLTDEQTDIVVVEQQKEFRGRRYTCDLQEQPESCSPRNSLDTEQSL